MHEQKWTNPGTGESGVFKVPTAEDFAEALKTLVWRAANQAGKSMVLAAALAWALNGDTAGGRDPAG